MNSRQTILLVEDEPDAVLLMQKALQTAGVTNPLQVVNDGEKAIAYLRGDPPYDDRSRYPVPAILLLDLKLPRKSGFEVLEWLAGQSSLRRLLTIVLTSSKEARDITRAYDCGANSYLVKPASFVTLVELIKSFKSYWINFNEVPHLSLGEPKGAPSSGKAG